MKIALVIQCKECKHFEEDSWGVINEVPLIVAHEICNFWGDGCKTDPEGYCFAGEKRKESDE